MKTVFRRVTIVSSGTDILADQNVLVADDRIAAISSSSIDLGVDRIVDCSNMLLIPGLVNAHYHSHNNYFRGSFDNLPLDACVLRLWNIGVPAQKSRLTPDQIYARTLLGCAEMLRTGTTTVIDDVNLIPWFEVEIFEAVWQAYLDSGMRAVVAPHLFDVPYPESIPFLKELLPATLRSAISQIGAPDTKELIEVIKLVCSRWGGEKGRVRLGLGPSGPQRCSDKLLLECARLSALWDLPLYIHVLESRTQAVFAKHKYSKSLVQRLYDLNFLSDRLSFGHAVWVTDNDIDLIAATGVTVCHNPVSNLKLSSGIAPINALKDRGVPIALGTDGVMSNDGLNMFESMKFASLLHKVRDPSPKTWIGAIDAFRMATEGGARSSGFGDIGRISVGAKADFVLINTKRASFAPRNDLLRQTVYSENGSSIATVVVDGKLVLERGSLITVDEEAMVEKVSADAAEFHKRVATSGRNWADELTPYFLQAFEKCWCEEVGAEAFGPRHIPKESR